MRGEIPRMKRSVVLTLLLLFVFSGIFYFNYYISDDAFITLRTADNFSHGHGLRWNIEERVQVFTSPLHFIVIALFYSTLTQLFGVVEPQTAYFVVLAISYIFSASAVILLLNTLRSSLEKVITFAVLMSSQAFVTFCSSGLETAQLYFILFWFLTFFFRLARPSMSSVPAKPDRISAPMFWLLGGLCFLTRFDTILLIGPAMVSVLVSRFRTSASRSINEVLFGLTPVIAWLSFSLAYFGFFFPNSYYAKIGINAPWSVLASMGVDYLHIAIKQDPITLMVILLTLFVCKKYPERLVTLGVLIYVVYVTNIGGDFIGYRFLSYPYFVCVFLFSRQPLRKLDRLRFGTAAVVGMLTVYNLVVVGSPVRVIRDGPISNDVSFWYPRTALRFMVRPLPEVAFVVTRDICGDRQDEVLFTKIGRGPAGLGPFCAGPGLHHVDLLGITDPLMARLPANADRAFLPGHLQKELPIGYGRSAGTSANHIQRPDIREYYDGLQLITSGELLSIPRWRAIASYNFGKNRRFAGSYPPTIAVHRSLREQYLLEDYPLRRWWR